MDQSEMPACEGCGTTDQRRTRNHVVGATAVLCDDCLSTAKRTLQARAKAEGRR